MRKSRQCPVGTCTMKATPRGTQHCTTCGLVPCPLMKPGAVKGTIQIVGCDLVIHPVPILQPDGTHYPPEFDAICRVCGQRTVWSPLAGAKASDPGVLKHEHDEIARRHGHPVRDLAKEDDTLYQAILADAAKAHVAREKAKAELTAPSRSTVAARAAKKVRKS